MKLTLSKVIPSPLGKHLEFIHALESKGAFLIGDRWKVVHLPPDGIMELLWQTTDPEVAYQWRGACDDRIPDALDDEIRNGGSNNRRINGFKLLSKEDRKRIEQSDLYQSSRVEQPKLLEGHDGILLAFAGKSISILKFEGENVVEQSKIRTKGREPITRALHPKKKLIVYGTNHGELYGQPFDADKFGRSLKIDQLPNTCYQVAFSGDGKKLFAAGMGYVKIYSYDGNVFTSVSSISTAVRSFEIVGNCLVLNKGMHGIGVMNVLDKPESIASMELPFMLDQMVYLASQKTFLLISGSTDEWAFLTWSE